MGSDDHLMRDQGVNALASVFADTDRVNRVAHSDSPARLIVRRAAKSDVPMTVLDRPGISRAEESCELVGRRVEDVITTTGHALAIRIGVLPTVVRAVRVRAVQSTGPLREVPRQIMHALGRCAGRSAADWLVCAAGPRKDCTCRRGCRVTPGIEAAFAPAGSRLPFRLGR